MPDVAAAPTWLRYVVGGTVVALAFLLLAPAAAVPDRPAALVLYGGVSASAVACLAVGVRRHRPGRPLAWHLLLAGQALVLLADLTFAWLLGAGPVADPSAADALYLAHAPFVAAGVLALARSRTPGSDRVSVNDAAIVATSLAVLSWVFLVEPALMAEGTPAAARVASVAYAAADLLVLAAVARLVAGVGFRPPAYYLLVLSLAALLAADTAATAVRLDGSWQLDGMGGSLLAAGRLASYLLLGAAALHPSMRSLTEPDHRATPRSGWGRLSFLAGASLLPPAVIVLQELRGRGRDTWVIGLACMALFLLVIVRMAGLVRMVERNAAQLRSQGAELQTALDELADTEAKRKQLLDKTMRSAEEERTRIAAELHDGPIQRLTAVGYRLEEAQLALEGGDAAQATGLVGEVRRELYAEIGGLRRLMAALRPPVLDERGLTLALRDLLEAFERRTGVECALQGESRLRVEPEIETVLYRVVQEALNNVAKHADARHVWVYVRVDDDRVDMQVSDDGVGFDASSLNGLVDSGHFGLAGMRERVEIAGGSHRLISAPGNGTAIRVRLPRRRVPA
jgi:signal transduction histidine kinase